MKYQEILQKVIENSPHLSWLQDGVLYFARTGSHSYGCATPESDNDFKGITITPKQYYFSPFYKFEQAELKDPDLQIYDFGKFIKLATAANPNILELLFINPEDHQFVSPLGEELISHRDLFLSKKVKHTFSGYAYSQIARIKLHRSWLLNPVKAPPTRKELGLPECTLIPADQLAAVNATVRKELDKFNFDFLEGLAEDVKIGLKEVMTEMLSSMKISLDDMYVGACRSIGLNDNLIEVCLKEREYESKKRHWNQYQTWLRERNPKRAELEKKYLYDAKCGYHVYRLGSSAERLLRTGKLIVKCPDRDVIMAIRNGEWPYEKLLEWSENNNKICEQLYKTSEALPMSPNQNKINQVCLDLVERGISLHK